MKLATFSRVLAPAHSKSFHLGALHYHFTPTGGAVVLAAVVLILFGGAAAAVLFRSRPAR